MSHNMRNKKETIPKNRLKRFLILFASLWDLNSTEAKLSNDLTHVEGAYLKLNRRCFVTDGREERTMEMDGVEDGRRE